VSVLNVTFVFVLVASTFFASQSSVSLMFFLKFFFDKCFLLLIVRYFVKMIRKVPGIYMTPSLRPYGSHTNNPFKARTLPKPNIQISSLEYLKIKLIEIAQPFPHTRVFISGI